MIINLELSRFKKARIWMDELPDIGYQQTDILESAVNICKDSKEIKKFQVALELFVPAGAQQQYGILGATFSPYNSDTLKLYIATSNDSSEDSIDWSLANGVDNIYKGLPKYYAEYVLSGVLEELHISPLVCGTLCFDHAAYGMHSSSPFMFKYLSKVVVRLISSNAGALTKLQLSELLENWNI